MLTTITQVCAALAVLGNAVVYGTDISFAAVLRPVYAKLDDATVTFIAGWGHYYGDRRMPIFGAGGVVATVTTMILAAVDGHTGTVVAAGIALAALLTWLAFYVRVAKPINTAQTVAAQSGVTPADARELQDRWESIIHIRVALQVIALAALCAALAL